MIMKEGALGISCLMLKWVTTKYLHHRLSLNIQHVVSCLEHGKITIMWIENVCFASMKSPITVNFMLVL